MYDKAIQMYDKAIELNPKKFGAYSNKWNTFYDLWRYEHGSLSLLASALCRKANDVITKNKTRETEKCENISNRLLLLECSWKDCTLTP